MVSKKVSNSGDGSITYQVCLKIDFLSDIEKKLTMGDFNFYYYEISAEDSETRKINFETALQKTDFVNQDITIPIEKRKRNYKLYIKRYEEQTNGFYFGVISRLKSVTEFALKERGVRELKPLSEIISQEGELAEIERDMALFSFTMKNGNIYLLIETGFQYPGVGVFEDFIKKLIQRDDICFIHKHITKAKDVQKIKRLFGQKLKKISIHFKRKSKLATPYIDGLVKNIGLSDDYCVNLEVNIRKIKHGKFIKVKDFLKNFFNVENNDIDELLTVNWAESMSQFLLFTVEGESQKTVNFNLLKYFEGEYIDTSDLVLNKIDELAVTVCKHLVNKIEDISGGN